MTAMAPLRALLLAGSLAAAAAAAPSAQSSGQARYFPNLPTPLAPFIDFYETHLDPEEFVVLRGSSGTLAFITFAVLMLAANMGYLPLNPATLKEDISGKFNPFVLEDKRFFNARSIRSQIEDAPLSVRLPGCLPLLLCSMELSGWTVSLQSEPGRDPSGLLAGQERRWTGPLSEDTSAEVEASIPEEKPSIYSGDACRRFRVACAVPLLGDFL